MRFAHVPSLVEILDPRRCALIAWDMQVGIAARTYNVRAVVSTLLVLLNTARACGVLVIWSQHVMPPLWLAAPAALRAMMIRQGVDDPALLRAEMQAGSEDVAFIPGCSPRHDELVVAKSTPSLFVGTPVELHLRARGITTIVVAGVATEKGVELTARHGLALGFFAVVAEDAVGSFSLPGHEMGLALLRSTVDVMSSEAIVRAWQRSGEKGA